MAWVYLTVTNEMWLKIVTHDYAFMVHMRKPSKEKIRVFSRDEGHGQTGDEVKERVKRLAARVRWRVV